MELLVIEGGRVRGHACSGWSRRSDAAIAFVILH